MLSLTKGKYIKAISMSTILLYIYSLFVGLVPVEAAFSENPVVPINKAKGIPSQQNRKIPEALTFFVANNGQKGDKVSYYADLPVGTMFVSKEGELVYSLFKTDDKSVSKIDPKIQGWVLKETLVNASDIKPRVLKELRATINHFTGDKSKWKKGLKTYSGLSLGEPYPDIEVTLKAKGNNIEKLFKVLPGADVGQIQIQVEGTDKLSVGENGQLEIFTGLGPVAFTKPLAYQERNGQINYIPVKYWMKQNIYGFEVGDYDKTLPLIIDPLLASTYFAAYTNPYTIKVGNSGEVYIGGRTLNASFPTTVGAYDTTHNIYYDAFVSKFSSDLSTLISSTYIGGGLGTSGEDYCAAIDVDSSGNVFISGATNSPNFPATASSYDQTHNGDFDVFVAKFDTDLGNLLSSTFIGNSYKDQASDLVVDKSGNIFITGNAVGGYPTTQGVYDSTANGYNDAFITKLDNNLTTILASTFIGARYDDNGKALALDNHGNVYVTGSTFNSNFPTTSGAYSKTYNGGTWDMFVAKFSPNLDALIASTFLGGSNVDQASSLCLDNNGNVYIGGQTSSLNYPATIGSFANTVGGSSDGVISKLSPNLDRLDASTYLDGSASDTVNKVITDSGGDVIAVGNTDSTNFPVTIGAFDRSHNNGTDAFYLKITDTLSSLRYSTFYGGNYTDSALAADSDEFGFVYFTGYSNSNNLPVTAGAFQTTPTYGGGYITKFFQPISGDGAIDYLLSRLFYPFNFSSMIADPVDTSTGAHLMEKNILTVNGAIPIDFKLQYNSLLLNAGPMGKGWVHNYETHLNIVRGDVIELYWNANRFNRFVLNGTNQYISSDLATKYDTLIKNTDGSYTLTRKDHSVYQFDTEGKLTEQTNGQGQSLTMSYNSEGRIETISEPISSRYITIHYGPDGLVNSLSDPLGRTVSFEYTTNQNLIKITDAKNQSVTYTYYPNNQIKSATDHEGVQLFYNTYDERGRVSTQDDGRTDNQLTIFEYDEITDPGKLITTVTDRNGQQRVLTHDSKYQLISVTDELGNNIARYEYDDAGNVKTFTDANGKTKSFDYDSRDNLLTATDHLGTTSMTYYPDDNLESITNAVHQTVYYYYNSDNNIIKIKDSLNQETNFEYYTDTQLLWKTITPGSGTTEYIYVDGQVLSIKNPVGNTVTNGYDAVGRLKSVTVDGKTTTFTYDNADDLISITDPLGRVQGFSYDSHHNILSETDAKQKTTRYTYTSNGKLEKVVDAVYNETIFKYDGEDRLKQIIDARGNTTTYIYDAKGRLTGVEDPLGNKSTIQYDVLDRITDKWDALNNKILSVNYDDITNTQTITDAVYRSSIYQYDSINRLIRMTDPMSRSTEFRYDPLDRLLSTIDPMDGESSQRFDLDGNLQALVDPNTNETCFEYYADGNLKRRYSLSGYDINYQYNARGLLDRLTNSRGHISTYQYYDDGRLKSFTDPTGTVTYTYDANGNIETVSDNKGTTSREYDELNRVIKYTDVFGNIIEYGYDAVGNLTSLVYPGGKTVTYGYDKANRLTSVTDWANRTTTYEYDANGRLTKTIRPNGTTLINTYDAAGQILLMKDTDSSGAVISQFDFTYDPSGNVLTEQGRAGDNVYTLNNSYDDVYHLLQQQTLNGSGGLTEQHNFSYDPAGNMTVGQAIYAGPSTVMTYTYDNRLASFNGQAVSFDADGNMTRGPLNGTISDFSYDSRNRLMSAGNLNYTYDAENNRISVTEGVYTTRYAINPNAFLSQVLIKTDPDGNQTFYVYGLGLLGEEKDGAYRTYHYDRRGSTVAITDESGSVTDRFEYSPYGELLNHSGNTNTPFLYNGWDGVMSDSNGLYYMRTRYYNPGIKRFVNQDILLGSINDSQSLNRYAYVNGNPVSYVDPFGLSALDSDYQGTGQTVASALNNFNNKYIAGPLNNAAKQVTPQAVENVLSNSPLYNLNEAISGKSIITGNLTSQQRQAKADLFSSQMQSGIVSLGVSGVKTVGPTVPVNGVRFTPDQQVLVDLAKNAKKTGITSAEAPILLDWASEYNMPGRGPEIHPNRNYNQSHIHIGPVNHIGVND